MGLWLEPNFKEALEWVRDAIPNEHFRKLAGNILWLNEQEDKNRSANNKCSNPSCPGHGSGFDKCTPSDTSVADYWKWKQMTIEEFLEEWDEYCMYYEPLSGLDRGVARSSDIMFDIALLFTGGGELRLAGKWMLMKVFRTATKKTAGVVLKQVGKVAVKEAGELAVKQTGKAILKQSGKAIMKKSGETVLKASSRRLARNMAKEGIERAPGYVTHHIVAGGSRFAQRTRAILRGFGIGIDDAANGVFLPRLFHKQAAYQGVLSNSRKNVGESRY